MIAPLTSTFHCDKVDNTKQFVYLMAKGLIVIAVSDFEFQIYIKYEKIDKICENALFCQKVKQTPINARQIFSKVL